MRIATQPSKATKAGASIFHLNAHGPRHGRPTQDPEIYRQFLPKIVAECDAVINITTSRSPVLTLEERLKPAIIFEPKVASFNMSTMNFGFYELSGQPVAGADPSGLPHRATTAFMESY